ncbi:MAG: hypothetical protein RIK87_24900 [Fuerstiella sp.]
MSRRKRNNNTRFSLFVFQDIITCVMGIMLLLTLIMCLQITSSVATADASTAAETVQQMKQQAAALSAEIAALQQSVDEQMSLLNSGAIDDQELLKNRSVTLESDNLLATKDVQRLWQQKSSSQTTLSQLQAMESQRRQQQKQTAALEQLNRELDARVKQLQSGERVVYNGHNSTSAVCWLVELTDSNTFQAAELGKSNPPQRFSSMTQLSAWVAGRHRSGAVFMFLVKPQAADVLEPLTDRLRSQNVTFGFDLLAQDSKAIDPATGAAVQ